MAIKVQLHRKSKNEIDFPALVIVKNETQVLQVVEVSGDKTQYKGTYITGPKAGQDYGLVPLENTDQFDVLRAGDEIILIQE